MVLLVRPYRKTEVNRSGFPSLDSISDIEKKINRKYVSCTHYVYFERSIVNAIVSFLTPNKQSIKILGLENARSAFADNRKLESNYKLDRVLIKKIPANHDDLSLSQLSDVIRLIVRECMWARLISGKRVVHFGWDSYIYFAGAAVHQSYINEFNNIGRVVENVKCLPATEFL